MADTVRTPGTVVLTPHHRGIVVDVRPTASGAFVVGVEYDDGEVRYFNQRALRLASESGSSDD